MDDFAEAQLSPYLIISERLGGERRVPLDKGSTWTIGRTPRNDVVLPADSVSRRHVMIQLTDSGQYYLIDLGSVNGSFVNGKRVSLPRALKDGDEIKIGENLLTFRYEGVAPRDTPTANTQSFEKTQALYDRRLITVMVVDIRDFTKLTQRIEENLLCRALGTWFRESGLIIQARGGWAIKYIGDAIMAVWLHQKPGEEQQDILAALSAYAEVAAASATLAEEFSLPGALRIGAGLNTGLASIGNVGGSEIEDFTATGDTVNGAFRIESSTKETGVDIALGGSTCKLLQRSFHPERYFQSFRVDLKGYDSSVDVWGATLESAQRFLASAEMTTEV